MDKKTVGDIHRFSLLLKDYKNGTACKFSYAEGK